MITFIENCIRIFQKRHYLETKTPKLESIIKGHTCVNTCALAVFERAVDALDACDHDVTEPKVARLPVDGQLHHDVRSCALPTQSQETLYWTRLFGLRLPTRLLQRLQLHFLWIMKYDILMTNRFWGFLYFNFKR